jgi:hypothetical protein
VGDRWIPLDEIAKMLGLSQRSVKALQVRGLPLRRFSPHATPGVLESELTAWIKKQVPDGKPIRAKPQASV